MLKTSKCMQSEGNNLLDVNDLMGIRQQWLIYKNLLKIINSEIAKH